MEVQQEHPSDYQQVNAMFTRPEPPLACCLEVCSVDLHRRSQPCNMQSAREYHLIYTGRYVRRIFRFSRADSRSPRRYTERTRNESAVFI